MVSVAAGAVDRLNYDARSILTTWGDRKASEYGLHEYGNRDWAGLTGDYYMPRWKTYFDSLSVSLKTGEPPKPIDWYAFGDRWNHSQQTYRAASSGVIVTLQLLRLLTRNSKLAPSSQGSADSVEAAPPK